MSSAPQQGIAKPVKKDKMADPKTYIHVAIGLILMFGGQFLPPIAPITEVGMQVLFIFIGVIYLWSTVESLWSSLLAVIALGMSDYANMGTVLKSAFGDSTVILVFFSMIFFGAILEAGVAEYISRWFLTLKINSGRPYVFSYIFVFGVYVVSALTNCFTALMISWPIAYTIIKDLGYTAKDKYAKFLVFGTFIGAILGQPAIPFRGTKLMMIEAFNKASGQTIGFLNYILFDVIMAAIIIFSLILLCRFVYRCDVNKVKNLDVSVFELEENKLPPMTTTQKFYFNSMFLYIVTLLAPTVLPTNWPIISTLAALGTAGITIVWVILCCVLRLEKQQVMNFKTITAKHVNWGMLFLVVVAIVMSGALTSDPTGIKPAIMNVLNPLLGGRGTLATAVILMVFGFLLTNVANNAVIGIIVLPVFGTFAGEAGMGAVAAPIAVCTMLLIYTAFLTPAASPYSAMLFANKEWLSPSDILKHGIPLAIVIFLLYATIGLQIAKFII